MAPPKKSKKSEGFHSAAGLIRYFDSEEDTALKISPWHIVALCIITIGLVEVIRYLTGHFEWW